KLKLRFDFQLMNRSVHPLVEETLSNVRHVTAKLSNGECSIQALQPVALDLRHDFLKYMQELVRLNRFQEIIKHLQAKCLPGKFELIVTRYKDNHDVRKCASQFLRRLQPALKRHPNIHDDDVGTMPFRQLQYLLPVFRFGNEL